MRVFISSVRRGLGPERDYLPDLIRAVGHEPLRFEDFGAQNAPSRSACLEGVNQADVYVLLLGAAYGDAMDDSGVAPTEEEYNVAQQRGIPILVFKKQGVTYETEQQEFIKRLGDYSSGRFWDSFTDDKSLGVGVIKALHELEIPAPPLTYLPLEKPVAVRWRTERTALLDRRSTAPVLEVHALPAAAGSLLPVSQLAQEAERLASRGRNIGFYGQADALSISYDSDTAWAVRLADVNARRSSGEPQTNTYSGLAIGRDGSAMAFQALPTDMLGTLINQEDLQQRLTSMLRVIAPHLPSTEHVALAAALEPVDLIAEGDPARLGARNSGSMGHGRGPAARAEPVDRVARASLSDGLPAVSADLTIRLLQAFRNTGRPGW